MERIIIVGRVGKHQRDIIYNAEGISPAINGVGCEVGYNNQPKIVEWRE